MRAVIQRVSEASVTIDSKTASEISNGLLILLAVEAEDSIIDADWLIGKIIRMRIFGDDDNQMNLSVQDVHGELLVVSQFTLFSSTKKGNRPSFIKSAKPDIAIPIYEYFLKAIEAESMLKTKAGVFGADMQVKLVNNGPVTIIIDSKNKE